LSSFLQNNVNFSKRSHSKNKPKREPNRFQGGVGNGPKRERVSLVEKRIRKEKWVDRFLCIRAVLAIRLELAIVKKNNIGNFVDCIKKGEGGKKGGKGEKNGELQRRITTLMIKEEQGKTKGA